MALSSPLDYLPEILPLRTTRTTESHEFTVVHHGNTTTTEYVYRLDKSPIDRVETVEGTVAGGSYTFTQGIDYAVVDSNGDGVDDAIDFSIGGTDPDDNTAVEVTYVSASILNRYVGGHDDVVAGLEDDLESVIESRQLDVATGDDLDRIGTLFGDLGKRRGRTDDEYRVFLKSIVQTFKGRGTKPGMQFAIAAGVGTDPSNVVIDEDFSEVGYEIRIQNLGTQFLSSVVSDMAELADPSGVELLSDPVVVLDGATVLVTKTESTESSSSVGLGGGTLDMDGTKTLG